MRYVSTLTVDELNELLQKSFTTFLKELQTEVKENSIEESNLVNIKVVMEKLKVTKPTVYNWIKKGYIKPQKIGGKVLFDLPVILKSLKMYDHRLRRGVTDYSHLKIPS